MGTLEVVNNIYYSINRYNESLSIINKVLHLSTAVSLTKALVQREGVRQKIKLRVFDSKSKKTVEVVMGKNEIVDTLEKFLNEISGVLTSDSLAVMELILHSPSVGENGKAKLISIKAISEVLEDAQKEFAKIDQIKQTLVEILILLGYDNVELSKLTVPNLE